MYSDEKQKEILDLYSREMEIIKLRTNMIFSIGDKLEFLQPTVEFQALQLRKIIEQIVLSSLIANADTYKTYYDRLEHEWNARLICRDIKRIHEDYFPASVIGTDESINDCPDRTIFEEELLKAYEKTGKMLQSKNPFSSSIDYHSEQKYIIDTCNRIVRFLNVHRIRIYGDDDFLYVVMKSQRNGHVAINWFSKVEEGEDEISI